MRNRRLWLTLATVAAVLAFSTHLIQARVPPDIEAQLKKIGRVIDAPGTAEIYGPLLAHQSYTGVDLARNISYASAPRNLLDVFWPKPGRQTPRPVLIYVPGGIGIKQLDYPNGAPFYDNIMLAAVKNGMVGVNMERRSGPGTAWDDGAKDIATVIAWVHQNIARYGGNPDNVFIWGQSAGANALSIYLSHPEYYPAGGVGVIGAIEMSGSYNLLPLKPTAPFGPIGPGDRGAAAPNAAPPAQPVDPAVQLQRSTLPGLRSLKLRLFVTAAELDPERLVEVSQILRDQLCDAGHCPHYQLFKGESHISQVMGINTSDTGVSGSIFSWIKSIN